MQLQELSEAWHRATGDSHRVHVSIVTRGPQAVRELTKYVGKIAHRSWEHRPELLAHAMRELSGRRLESTFGDWRGVELAPAADDDSLRTWVEWGSLDALIRLDAAGDADARALMRAIVTGLPVQVPAEQHPHPTLAPTSAGFEPSPPGRAASAALPV